MTRLVPRIVLRECRLALTPALLALTPALLALTPALLALSFILFAPADVSADEGPTGDAHLQTNPVYRTLVTGREAVPTPRDNARAKLRLPAPLMADGLDAAEQREVLRELAADRYDVDDLLRPSVVAPYVLKLDREPLSDTSLIAQQVRLGFVARGDLDALTRDDFLASFVPDDDGDSNEDEPNDADVQPDELPPEAWRKAGIAPPSADQADRQRVRPFETTLFDRVRLRGVVRAYWTETDDSILLAAVTDDRFADVDGFRPAWTRFERAPDGSLDEAESGDFAGGGFYLKVTRLREPEGALFFESNGVLLESHSWFGGANLIGSKLPPAIQSQVRDVRRQTIRASRP